MDSFDCIPVSSNLNPFQRRRPQSELEADLGKAKLAACLNPMGKKGSYWHSTWQLLVFHMGVACIWYHGLPCAACLAYTMSQAVFTLLPWPLFLHLTLGNLMEVSKGLIHKK